MSGVRPHKEEAIKKSKMLETCIDKGFSTIRGYSSAGGALEWHSRGRGFESHYLHLNYKLRAGMLVALIITYRDGTLDKSRAKKVHFQF